MLPGEYCKPSIDESESWAVQSRVLIDLCSLPLCVPLAAVS